jgi:hypothetical protein
MMRNHKKNATIPPVETSPIGSQHAACVDRLNRILHSPNSYPEILEVPPEGTELKADLAVVFKILSFSPFCAILIM